MTRFEYRAMDWQSQDEAFTAWVDQYLVDNGLPSFEQEGDYGHVDLRALKRQFLSELA